FDQDEILARIKMLLKTKESNDRLSQAYNNFAMLATFGEEAVRTFDPLTFELQPNIDRLISKVIRQNNEMIFQPQGFIVGILEEKGWELYFYEYSSKGLQRCQFELDIQKLLSLPARGSSRVVIAERSELADKGLKSFTVQLETHPLLNVAIENIFCFFSNDLCVFALNYNRGFTAYETSIFNSLVMQIMFFKSLADQGKRAEGTFVHSIRSLLRASEIHDIDTGNHNLRVGECCALLARHLNKSENLVRTISQQAQMHDVGNIYIAGEILRKRSSPTFEEWNIIRKHTLFGAEILSDNPFLSIARTIALSHHENWNGSGYPHMLKGEQIPMVARIASLADRYDSLRNSRPYKPAWDHKTAYEKLIGGDNRIQPEFFDPQVLEAFKELATQFEAIYEKHKG
ncbi:MAG: HD domain-containing protein, partial [Acidobacteria bacterium]|nr:HD domain-containing protein [Acidobacteriota bacterium]